MTNPPSTFRSPSFARRLGVFGGSFDPVHLGHMMLARCCQEQAQLDAVWLVPAACQPLKPHGPIASNDDRLAMLRLACEEQADCMVSTIEIDRGGVSYTVDTLATIRKRYPKTELFFLMGADALADLPKWHRPTEICTLATPLVVCRAGSPSPNFDVLRSIVDSKRIDKIRRQQVEMPAMPISSSAIRTAITTDAPWRDALPPTVAGYIEQRKLYQQ